LGEESTHFYHERDKVYKKNESSGSEKQPLTCNKQGKVFFSTHGTDSQAIPSRLTNKYNILQ
jgi:hypothetical protein